MQDGDDILNQKAGTLLYFAPEMCKGKTYHGKPADIWACGVVLFFMATLKFPFEPNLNYA